MSFTNSNFPLVEVSGVSFFILGDDDNERDSCATIRHSEAYRGSEPANNGPVALALGTVDYENKCMTCLHSKKLCPGHPGILKLNYPVLTPMFLKKQVIKWLKIICSTCGNIKISDAKLQAIIAANTGDITKQVADKTYSTQLKNPHCAYCGSVNLKYSKDSKDHVTIWKELYEDTKEMKLIDKDVMYPHEVMNIFNMVTDETLEILRWPIKSHPKKFIITKLRIPANAIRPSINRLGSGRVNKDNLTKFIQMIININDKLPETIPDVITNEFYQEIQNLGAMVYEFHRGSDNSDKGVVTNSRQPLKSVMQRLTKKKGHIRGNLMGARTWFTARSIITCDPSLKPDEIGLPIRIAKDITQRVFVQSYNYDQCLIYFMNGANVYPGCNGVTVKSTGRYHSINNIQETFQLSIGDIIHRHVISGDTVNFNRQPSLEPSSISSMKCVVNGVKGSDPMDTIRLNVISCPLFNADFDGDEMNIYFIQSSRTANEIDMLSSPQQRFIQYKNSAPMMGQSQDNLIGCVELTRNGTLLDKKHAMRILGNTSVIHDFSQYPAGHMFTGQDIVTILLTETGNFISYEGKPRMYNKNLEQYRTYDEKNINVEIKQGRHISGILDKKSIGEGSAGGIYHMISTKYNPQQALTAIYDMQQMALSYTMIKGITIRAHDAILNKASTKAIHEVTENMFADARDITDKLNAGELIAPLGKTITEYYEQLQMNALNPGDEFWPHIFNSIDEKHNYLLVLPDTGVKGKSYNFIQSSCSLGQLSVNGGRLPEKLDGRVMPYFTKYDADPRSRGYIPDSFGSGLSMASFWSGSIVGRLALIDRSSSTAVTGEENRKAIKNLESQIVNYTRTVERPGKISQILYGGDGVDVRFLEEIKYFPATMSDEQFAEAYQCSTKSLDKKYHNKNVEELLDNEFATLQRDREIYRDKFIKRELNTNRVFNDRFLTPINIYHIIMDAKHSHKDGKLDIVSALERIHTTLNNLVYAHTNEEYENNQGYIPNYLHESVLFICIVMRAYLCSTILLKYGISDEMLDKILLDVKMTFLKSLVDYGKCVGVIAAQSISQPMVQSVIDAHHASGAASENDGGIDYIKGLLKVAPIKGTGPNGAGGMKNPKMKLYVIESVESDYESVRKISNEIEMLTLGQFIGAPKVFWESYGKPVHPQYIHESVVTKEFEKYNPNISPPSDLTKICIRYVLLKEKLIEKNISVEDIYIRLQEKFTNTFIVYNADNSADVIFKVYLRNTAFKKDITKVIIGDFVQKMTNTVIRGVSGIFNSVVKNKNVSFIQEDGSIGKRQIYYITTNGSNIYELLLNPMLDPSRMDSNCLVDINDCYGIEAMRSKFIDEMYEQLTKEVNYKHFTNYADEMTWTGIPTGINRYGSAARDASILMQFSDGDPLRVIEHGAVMNKRDDLMGVSSSLILGQCPHIGSMYSTFKIDEDMLKDIAMTTQDILEDI